MVFCFDYNCNKYASFNYLYNKYPLYCKKHKKDEMVDVSHEKCINQYCNIRASFGFLKGRKLYCLKHKSEFMINLNNKKSIKKNNKKKKLKKILIDDNKKDLK